jgi:hypothetical protein
MARIRVSPICSPYTKKRVRATSRTFVNCDYPSPRVLRFFIQGHTKPNNERGFADRNVSVALAFEISSAKIHSQEPH